MVPEASSRAMNAVKHGGKTASAPCVRGQRLGG